MKKVLAFLLIVGALHAEFLTLEVENSKGKVTGNVIQYNEKLGSTAIVSKVKTDIGTLYTMAVVVDGRYIFAPEGRLPVTLTVGKIEQELLGSVFKSGDGLVINVDEDVRNEMIKNKRFQMRFKDKTYENFIFEFDTSGLDFEVLAAAGGK